MNMGSSLLLLALLVMLGGTPTYGFEELKKVTGTLMPTTTKTRTPQEMHGSTNDSKVPALLRLFEGGKSLGHQTKDNSSCNDVGEPLILTPYIDKHNIVKGKKKARLQPFELTKYGRGYAAYLTVKKEYESNLFFWYVLTKNKKKTSTAPLVIWLNGGPGASSMFGLFNENGPYAINKKDGEYSVFGREVTWTEEYNMLYIDQPTGTGFSFTKDKRGYAMDEDMVANDMYKFIWQFFLLFPNRMNNDFYLTGQSYAGKFVPVIANKIHEMNKLIPLEKNRLPLKGLAIGNGLTDPIHQFFWGDFLFQAGLVDKKGKDEFAAEAAKARTYIQEKKWRAAADVVWKVVSAYEAKTGVDFYNFIDLHVEKPWMKYYPEYIKQPRLRKEIHVGNQPFNKDNLVVHGHLIDDVAQSEASLVQTLLDEKYKILLYNGHLDAFITYRGTEQYIRDLTWEGASEYKKATRKIWMVDGVVAGYAREVLTLRQVMVRNAGHLVPTDQPEWAFDMIKRFVNGDPFGNSPGRNSSG